MSHTLLFLRVACRTEFECLVLFVCRSLQRTLNELKEYQKQHDHYLRQQSMLDKHKLIQEEQILRNIIHETQMAKEAQFGETDRQPALGLVQIQTRVLKYKTLLSGFSKL